MFKIARNELGYAAKIGVSPYELMTEILRNRGIHKPCNLSDKAFVNQNLEVLTNISKEPPSFSRPRKVTEKLATAVKEPKPSVADDAFLFSFEWRRLRMRAIKLHGARCQCCGATPKEGAVINVDHIKPRKKYPELALCLDNLQVLCNECNHGKGNWDETDWRVA